MASQAALHKLTGCPVLSCASSQAVLCRWQAVIYPRPYYRIRQHTAKQSHVTRMNSCVENVVSRQNCDRVASLQNSYRKHVVKITVSSIVSLPEGHVFKEIAEQRFPLSVFLVEALPYFRQPLRSLGSLFSRRCHCCRSREFGGSSCKQRVVICWNHVIHALLQINFVDCWRIWMINIKS